MPTRRSAIRSAAAVVDVLFGGTSSANGLALGPLRDTVGRDAYALLSDVLKHTSGTEAGHDVLPLGTADFSPTMTTIRNSGADLAEVPANESDGTCTSPWAVAAKQAIAAASVGKRDGDPRKTV